MLDKLYRLIQNTNRIHSLLDELLSRINKMYKVIDGIEIFKCGDLVIVCGTDRCLIAYKSKQITIDDEGIKASDNEVIDEVSEKISECDEVVKFIDETLPKSEEVLKTFEALKTLLDMLEK
jgi:hypothetical protein